MLMSECTPLSISLNHLCLDQIADDAEYQRARYLDRSISSDCDGTDVMRNLFEDYRLFKLQRTLKWVSNESPFYRSLFKHEHVDVCSIKSFDDIAYLPFTTPDDIADNPNRFLCVSQREIERIISFSSSGTTGPAKQVFFTLDEIGVITDFMSAGMKTVADASDVVQILLPEGPMYGQCDLLARGVTKMGAKPVVSGMFLPFARQIECIKHHGSTVLFGETHLLYRLTKTMETSIDLASLGVRVLFLTTSYASPCMIEYLQNTWGARVSIHYGLTEMGLGFAVDCPTCGQRHYDELDMLVEKVDLQDGQVLPDKGEGELVFTTLTRRAMPLIRYRSQDIASFGWADSRCPCNNMRTIGDISCRNDTAIRFGNGAILSPTTFHEALFTCCDVIDYCVSIHRDAVGDYLHFQVHARHMSACDRMLRLHIAESMRRHGLSENLMRFEIEYVPKDLLSQGRHFKKVVVDYRLEVSRRS